MPYIALCGICIYRSIPAVRFTAYSFTYGTLYSDRWMEIYSHPEASDNVSLLTDYTKKNSEINCTLGVYAIIYSPV